MNYEDFAQNVEPIIEERQRRSTWQKIVTVLACVVVFCTTYALILPAITSENETYCSLDSHTHSQECYVQTSEQAAVLSCSPESLGVHIHGSECMDEAGNAICGQVDFVVHSHNERCYDSEGELRCLLPERTGHVHTDACYALAEPTVHHHDESCNEQVKNLICELAEEAAHAHTDDCYAVSETLLCTQEHSHGASCYERTLLCELAETSGHSHSDACYEPAQVISCGLEEGQTDSSAEPILICEIPVATEHVHTDACFASGENVLNCGLEENEAHTHEAMCYGTWALTCELEEHVHAPGCFSDPTADVENAEQWEATINHAELSGNWADDVLTIAKTQLGYEESTKNYLVEESGVVKGYTRYGQWYGDAYGDWCAMFTSFCLHYAGVEGVPLHAACVPWIKELSRAELYRTAEEYKPYPGDIIFFDWEGDGASDHVGLVAEILPATDTHAARIRTIEGNSSNRVQYVTYDLDDARIAGYGMLPVTRVDTAACGLPEHAHGDACLDESGSLVCEIAEHTHSEACMRYTFVYADKEMRASAVIEGRKLPEDITLRVNPVEKASQSYDAMLSAMNEELTNGSNYIGGIRFYEMQLLSGDAAYELPEQTEMDVNVYFADPVFTVEQIEHANETHTFLLTADEVEAEASEEVVPSEGKTEADEIGDIRGEITRTEVPAVVQTPSADDESEISEEADLPEQEYLLQAAENEKYKNLDQGITGLNFRSTKLGVVAMALTTHTQTGKFWTRVSSTSELNTSDTYMIVSAEGNYALVGNNSTNYKAVMISCVKGHEEYYTISNSDNTDLHWKFNSTGSRYTLRNVGTSRYLALSSSSSLTSSSSKNLTLSYQSTEKCWRIAYNSYYLRNEGTGAFSRTNDDDGDFDTYGTTTTYYYTRDMLIFKLSDVTSLEITDDFVDDSSSSGDGENGPEKPDYDEIVTPSGGKTGDTAVADATDATVSVSGQYFSEPSTSDIEKEFRCDTFDENKRNDGKVLTDKSVIYGGDDYHVFDSYDANTFGITLSALGQEYEIPYQDTVRTPIDVVFVLDVSGSMTTNSTSDEDDDGRDPSRATAMTAATNAAIKQILEDHEANRVGVVVYSSGAWEVLPLGRYTANNDEYFVCKETTVKYTPTAYSTKVHFISGSASLKNEAGVSFANAGSSSYQGLGTYTQAGIALGNKLFADIGEDTTYTTVIGKGEYARSYTVNRQPVFILLSDGEPTHSTNIYMDPLSGPHYGDGMGNSNNARGIHGYNTILSANYFKRQVSIQYEKQTLFYTIGMGINTPEEGDGPQVSGSETGDSYKRAVLNPTPENIANLTSSVNPSTTTTQLKNMLLSNFTDQAVSVTSKWPDSWYGVPHRYVPVLQANPYANNYSYADEAYFGKLSSADLKEIFSNIITSSLKSTPYGFILYKNSSVELVDEIGEGMEIKGTPVLRYNGVNYTNPTVTVSGNVTTYLYNETFIDPYVPNRTADLSQISVTVTKDASGNQTVKMFVPDNILPTYTPELIGRQYYYEALPVRLIYQVGLTEAAEAAVLNLQKTGGELTFYTNRWNEESHIASSTLTPSTANPYYYDVNGDGTAPQYEPHQTVKSENVTQTYDYVVNCSPTTTETDDGDVMKIVHRLGNNGKLVFAADAIEIAVEKVWDGVKADVMNPVEVNLYKVTETVLDNGTTRADAELVQTLTVSSNEAWKAVFENVPTPEDPWYYAVAETVPAGYQVTYSAQTVMISVANQEPFMAAKVDITDPTAIKVTMTNSPAVELPATGGIGTSTYTIGGFLLLTMAGALLLYRWNKYRRKEDIVSS